MLIYAPKLLPRESVHERHVRTECGVQAGMNNGSLSISLYLLPCRCTSMSDCLEHIHPDRREWSACPKIEDLQPATYALGQFADAEVKVK